MLELDAQIFIFLNSSLANPVFDVLMPLLREKLIWIPLYIFIIAFTFQNFKAAAGMLFILFLIFSVSFSDFVSSSIIKENVERVRPCKNLQLESKMILRVRCGSGYSFTSSHATNHFCIALFLIYTLGRLIKSIRWPLIIWASLISFAQIYVGVHYPLDVICGALLGIAIGMVLALVYNRFISENIYQPVSLRNLS